MTSFRLATVGSGLIALLLAGTAAAAPTLEREFRYGPERVSMSQREGLTHVAFRGGIQEFRAGRPDLPLVSEQIQIPVGFRVARVTVTALETTPLSAAAPRMASAERVHHGVEPQGLSDPDPAFFQHDGFQPEVPVTLGYQGLQRDRNLATLAVTPVRWDARTGRLERVTRLAVRLELAADESARPLKRERIVREWESDVPSALRTTEVNAALTPVVRGPRAAQPFKATQVPSVLGSPVAYLIITGDSMVSAFQPFADWKTQCGQPAVIRSMSFVRQQYPFGADDATRVRMLIRDAYLRWGTQYVLLGGDTDVIPARLAFTTFYGGENIPSDMYYGCLDGNWDADGDSTFGEAYGGPNNTGDAADMYPEVWVGRAPVLNAADVNRFVTKTMTYEKTPVADYMSNFLFFAEVLFPQNWTPSTPTSLDGAELIEYDILPILDTVPWIHYARLYENHLDARWRPGALLETRAAVIDSLNKGYNVAVHVGHGYRTVMSCGDDNMSSNDANVLTNGNRLINLYAIDCTSNAIDFQSIGEAFVMAPNGGAVTNIGSTRFDFPTTGRYYQQEYFRLLFQDSVTAIGQAQDLQKAPWVAFSDYDGVNRWTQFTMLLLGDPALRVFTNTPRILSVTKPATIAVSDTTFPVNVQISGQPLFGALVTAYMAGRDFFSGSTDGAGNITVPFRADTLGAITLTVTAFNATPNQGTITVIANGLPSLAEKPATVLDDNLAGRHGNSNGFADAGELVDILVPVRNNGGSTAPSVNGTLSTTSASVSVTVAGASYGSIAVGATATPAIGFRLDVPQACPDQEEIPFALDLVDGNNRHTRQTFQLVIRAPDLRHFSHLESETGGNNNGRPEPGETVTYTFRVRNLGTGNAAGIYGRLRNYDGLATVLDSAFTVPDLGPASEASATPVRFVPSNANAKLAVLLFDQYGQRLSQSLDLVYPPTVIDVQALGAQSSIRLLWTHVALPDMMGYNVYRSGALGGPYTKLNPNPTDRISYYLDPGLVPLTRYYYEVAAVDSSGNEGTLSVAISASTNPPLHATFPIPTNHTTPSPVAVDHVYSGYPQELLVGSNVLYMLHADGTAPVDGDGSSATLGDFTAFGSYYAGGGSIGDLDNDGSKDVVGASWDSQELYTFDKQGAIRPNFPIVLPDIIWSSITIGDLDGNGTKEIFCGSRGNKFYAFRANGSEWMDGDANAGTNGVFKVLGSAENNGTAAIGDLLGNGQKQIVFGGADGFLYAWKPDGTNLPGFPVNLHGGINASPAIAKLDGPGGGVSIVIPTTGDSLFVIKSDGGRHAGFPVWLRTSGSIRTPSPAIADMNNDGFPDVVFASTNGGIFVIDRNGFLVFPWNNIRYSTMTAGASESSPVVADITGDGKADVVMGDETGNLAAIDGQTGTMLAGFPIQLEAEVKGPAALCDCDGDGMSEIVVAGWDRNIYMWDYDHPFSPGVVPPWPQFHHDAERTGNYATPILLDAGGTGGAPLALEFGSPWPNPARASMRLQWGVPKDQAGAPYEIAVFDLSGRRVQTVEQGTANAGRFSTAWNLRDANGARVGNGVYFLRIQVGAQATARKLVVVH